MEFHSWPLLLDGFVSPVPVMRCQILGGPTPTSALHARHLLCRASQDLFGPGIIGRDIQPLKESSAPSNFF